MAHSDQLSGGRIRGDMPGNHYRDLNVSGDARAHLGDAYHFGESRQEHQRRGDKC
jgi:hypothetical protein